MSESILAFLEYDGLTAEWIKAHLDYPEKRWCLMWPFSRNQGGYANVTEKGIIVSRLMCEWRNGPPPEDKPEAAHECGKGRDGCVNPWHLVWKSHGDNLRDTFRHGRTRKYTLMPEQVDEIRLLEGRMRIRDIAEKFGVTDTTIRQIHQGKIWRDPHPKQHFFTEEEIERIRGAHAKRGLGVIDALANEFGVSKTTIARIRKGIRPITASPLIPPHDGGSA
jgi:transcriptional regulator with XRE-family HTH domain